MKKKILIISQYFYPNNFRINDIVSKLPEKKIYDRNFKFKFKLY